MMKRNIVIVEAVSTGFNYVEDIRVRGYQPVVVRTVYPGTEEDRLLFKEVQDFFLRQLPEGTPVIYAKSNYEEVLEQVRQYDPLLVIAGSEYGVEFATKLASDLGLKGNRWENIGKMTRKDKMHQALADYGIRYIRGRIVKNEDEAKAFYQELDTTHIVVKRARGAATIGVHFCEGLEETLDAIRQELTLANNDEHVGDILMQERIIGKEYIVNTVSCAGKHRLVSMWQYDKVAINGSNVYNYAETINHLDVGHSRLVGYAYDVLNAIGIEWGAVHGEYMVDEKGPVLIEVNCRPMGANMTRPYIEQIFGHHETDVALDAYLDETKFAQDCLKPYRPKRKGIIKILILTNDVNLHSAPVLQVIKQLKSFYSASFDRIGLDPFMKRTCDLESSGGQIYLLSDNELQAIEDCAFLHHLEMRYPQMLFNELKAIEKRQVERIPIDQLLHKIGYHSSTLVFSDSKETSVYALVTDGSGLRDAYDSYEQGILDLSHEESFADVESLIQQIFIFMNKLREGGRVFIPESTYCHLPYGIEGMEILLHAAGLKIEAPMSNHNKMMIASKSTR